jgi:uncharacterized damage-inducible protein DinB
VTETTNETTTILSAEALLEHWQGHRRLTRRTIEAFPEDKLFSFSVGSMRPYSEMILEFFKMAEPSVKGLVTGEWESADESTLPKTKADLLSAWDRLTDKLKELWPKIPVSRFSKVEKAFGKWESSGIDLIIYVIDKEIHQRAQGFVYLRALGIEPPAFYDRS